MEIPAFDLSTYRTDGAAVVRVIGELDLSTAPRLRDALAELAGNGTKDVTVDLAEMSFIDSTGVSVLVSGLKCLREAGGDLALQSPRASTRKVLDITGLTRVFTIFGDAAPGTIYPEYSLEPDVTSRRIAPSTA